MPVVRFFFFVLWLRLPACSFVCTSSSAWLLVFFGRGNAPPRLGEPPAWKRVKSGGTPKKGQSRSKMDRRCRSRRASYTGSLSSSSARWRLSMCTGEPFCSILCLCLLLSVSACWNCFLCVCLSVCLVVCLSVCLPACLPACFVWSLQGATLNQSELASSVSDSLFVCLSVSLSACLPACLLCRPAEGFHLEWNPKPGKVEVGVWKGWEYGGNASEHQW